jgi:hypothetical protein
VPRRRQVVGQSREGLLARPTDSAPHPDGSPLIIVALTESPSALRRGLQRSSGVADDRVVTAERAAPRQEIQWDHPGSVLSFASGSAIKRIKAGVKARR